MKEPKILFWDLETMMNPEAVMDVFPGLSNYPGLTLKASLNSILCFGYKFLGDKEVSCLNAWDYKGWKKSVNDDEKLVKDAYKILEKADAFVTHNGRRFDLKFFNSRAIMYGLPALPTIPHIDTCQVAKSKLLLFNNKLNTVAKHLGIEQKLENGGWQLWVDVQKRNPKAMELMEKYCKQDVKVLEQIYLKLRPYMNQIPNYNLFDENGEVRCPSCGSYNVHKDGTRRTKTALSQRYKCSDCGSRSSDSSKSSVLRSY